MNRFRVICRVALLTTALLSSACRSNTEDPRGAGPPAEPDAAARAEQETPAERPAGTTGVARTTPDPETAPSSAVVAAIATQPGSRGLEVDLVRAEITGDLLTVELHYRNPTRSFVSSLVPIPQVSVIDDQTSRRYGVVKDQSGQFMAAPLAARSSDRIRAPVAANSRTVVWFKFPAPPPTSESVSINIPDVAPFDGIPLRR